MRHGPRTFQGSDLVVVQVPLALQLKRAQGSKEATERLVLSPPQVYSSCKTEALRLVAIQLGKMVTHASAG